MSDGSTPMETGPNPAESPSAGLTSQMENINLIPSASNSSLTSNASTVVRVGAIQGPPFMDATTMEQYTKANFAPNRRAEMT